MMTPRLGFGWNEVAFSGRSPPDSTRALTCAKSGLGSSTAGAAAWEVAVSASSTVWWCSRRGGAVGSRG